jgi:hypothetical protein
MSGSPRTASGLRHRRFAGGDHNGQCYAVYCIVEHEHAELFMRRFTGEKFDPERGEGSNLGAAEK